MEQKLIEILVERQSTEGLSDYAFADKLSVSRTLWTKTRNGDRRVASAVLRGAVGAYPDLAGLVMDIQAERVGLVPVMVPGPTSAPGQEIAA